MLYLRIVLLFQANKLHRRNIVTRAVATVKYEKTSINPVFFFLSSFTCMKYETGVESKRVYQGREISPKILVFFPIADGHANTVFSCAVFQHPFHVLAALQTIAEESKGTVCLGNSSKLSRL